MGKEIKCGACRAFYLFIATRLLNSIKQQKEYNILFIGGILCRFILKLIVLYINIKSKDYILFSHLNSLILNFHFRNVFVSNLFIIF